MSRWWCHGCDDFYEYNDYHDSHDYQGYVCGIIWAHVLMGPYTIHAQLVVSTRGSLCLWFYVDHVPFQADVLMRADTISGNIICDAPSARPFDRLEVLMSGWGNLVAEGLRAWCNEVVFGDGLRARAGHVLSFRRQCFVLGVLRALEPIWAHLMMLMVVVMLMI